MEFIVAHKGGTCKLACSHTRGLCICMYGITEKGTETAEATETNQ